MQDSIQGGSQNIKMYFMYFTLVFGNLHNNILGIHLCIMSVQSNFGHKSFSAKSLDVFVNFAK